MSLQPPGFKTAGQIIEDIEAGKLLVLPVAHWEILRRTVVELDRPVAWNTRQIGPIVYIWKAHFVTEN